MFCQGPKLVKVADNLFTVQFGADAGLQGTKQVMRNVARINFAESGDRNLLWG
jgi:hypothetical protein